MQPQPNIKYPKNLTSEERQEHWEDKHRKYMNKKNLKRREDELEALTAKLSKVSMMELLVTEEAWNGSYAKLLAKHLKTLQSCLHHSHLLRFSILSSSAEGEDARL